MRFYRNEGSENLNDSDETIARTEVDADCRSASLQDLNFQPLFSAWRPASLVHLASREVMLGGTLRQSWSLPHDSFSSVCQQTSLLI